MCIHLLILDDQLLHAGHMRRAENTVVKNTAEALPRGTYRAWRERVGKQTILKRIYYI